MMTQDAGRRRRLADACTTSSASSGSASTSTTSRRTAGRRRCSWTSASRRRLGRRRGLHRRRHAALRPGRPLGLPRAARRRPLLRDEPSAARRSCYRSAALIINLHGGTVPLPEHARDRPARLPRDRPGRSCRSSWTTACEADDRLPRAALRVLHLRRELRPPRLPAAGVRPVSTSGRRASRSCLDFWETAATAPSRDALHDRRQLAAAVARRALPRRASTTGASTSSS